MLAATSLNVTAIIMFATILLYSVSGEHMVRIQELAINELKTDFQLVLGTINSNLPSWQREDFLKKLRAASSIPDMDFERKKINAKQRDKALVLVSVLMVVSVLLYLKYPEGKVILSDFLFTVALTIFLFVTEIFVYFEIISKFRYNTKDRLYNEVFGHLLKNKDLQEIENNLCTTNKE
jgi:hypothetical protein